MTKRIKNFFGLLKLKKKEDYCYLSGSQVISKILEMRHNQKKRSKKKKAKN